MKTGITLALTLVGLISLSGSVNAQQRPSTIESAQFTSIGPNLGETPSGSPGTLITSFEEFALGDINSQNGWVGQFGNWVVSDQRPNTGAQHLESVSDGLGQTLLFAPNTGLSSAPVKSMRIRTQISAGGVTWQAIPQSPTAGFVVARIIINPDRSVSVLESDGVGGSLTTPTGYTFPIGQYVEFGLQVDDASLAMELFADGVSIHQGLAFAGDMEQFVGLSLMEVAGPTWDIDDLEIIDGGLGSPDISFDNGDVGFGSTEAGNAVPNQFLTITNNGSAAGTVSAPVISGPFSLVGGTCPAAPFDLAPAASCTFEVAFTGGGVGNSTGTFTVNAGGTDITANLSASIFVNVPNNSTWALAALIGVLGLIAGLVLVRRNA